MGEAAKNCHRHGKHQEPGSLGHVLGLAKNGTPIVAPLDYTGSPCRPCYRCLMGLGGLGSSKNPPGSRINFARQDTASNGRPLPDSILYCKSPEDQRYRR